MRILHTESSLNWGGQEYRTLLEHNYINNIGYSSWLLCDVRSAIYKKALKLNCINIIVTDLKSPLNIITQFKILYYCKKYHINLINSHSAKDSFFCITCFFFGVPLIRSRHITNIIKKKTSYQYFCSHVLATAHTIKDNLLRIGVSESRVTTIGEGVDLDEFNPDINSAYLKKEFNIKKTDIVIINIGMIREDKGQIYFLEAANKILKHNNKNYKFFLIGESTSDTRLKEKLQKLINAYEIKQNFIMTGYREDIAQFINLSDLVVIASIGTEAQSRVAPQASASRRAVVSTNVGGLTEIVKDQINGLVIPPKDIEAMSNAILKLINDDKLRNKLSVNGYKMTQQSLSFKHMMDDTFRLYSKFIDRAN